MAARRRRPGPARSAGWRIVALAVGVVLLLVGGYLQLRPHDKPAAGQATQSPTPTSQSSQGQPTQPSESAQPQPSQQQSTVPPEVRSTAPVLPADPVRVTVPKLGVSARVLAIRARGGALLPPANPLLVGWWSDGARPGASKGSAIITGHTVHTGGGAFDKLDELTAGDAVSVRTGRSTISYTVTSVKTYRKKALATRAAQLFSQSVPGRLVLVTCDDWDGTAYLSNAVVIAVPKT